MLTKDAILASTLIRHALRPPPIRALTVSMIQSPPGGLLMPPIGFPALLAALVADSAHCNSDGLGRNGDRSKTVHRSLQRGTSGGGKQPADRP